MHASEGSTTGKSFWKTVKPFISTKGTLSSDNIIIEAPNDTTINVKEGDSISTKRKDESRDEKVLVEMFNNLYINIAEKTGLTPKSIGNSSNPDHDKSTVKEIIESYKKPTKHN